MYEVEDFAQQLRTLHGAGTKIRVIFNDIIGLHRTSSGTLGTPTNTAILHYGSKGAHFVPITPR